MTMMERMRRHGLVGSARKGVGVAWRMIRPYYHAWRFRQEPRYVSPTEEELTVIERDLQGLDIAIDLAPVAETYRRLPYYRTENATPSRFADGSVRGVSLHCAYEMFMGGDDTRLIGELACILKPGGKAVILPLYLHTQYCAYATPAHFGKGYADPGAKEYIRFDCYGVPSSRKYDVRMLQRRVLEPITRAGLGYRLSVLRNKESLGSDIYCHFVLDIEK